MRWIKYLPLLGILLLALLPSTPIHAQSGTDGCIGAPPVRLGVGMQGQVITDEPLRLRDIPGGEVITRLPAGITFEVIGGPTCLDGFNWWEVSLSTSSVGWLAEGDSQDYYIEPLADPTTGEAPATVTTIGVFYYCGDLPSHMLSGMEARVVDPLFTMYDAPNGTSLGAVVPDTTVLVLDGPQCVERELWWWVTVGNGVEYGWAREADGGNLLMAPTNNGAVGGGFGTRVLPYIPPANEGSFTYCIGAPRSRLWVGMQVQVNTGGLPLRVRTEAGSNGAEITQIPPNTIINVVGGPECRGPDLWWQVASGAGEVGWSAERIGNTFYLVPAPTSGVMAIGELPTEASYECNGALPSRMVGGGVGQVVAGTTMNFRDYPGGDVIGRLNSGVPFLADPVIRCVDGLRWFNVRLTDGRTGWLAEAAGSDYLVERAMPSGAFCTGSSGLVVGARTTTVTAVTLVDDPYTRGAVGQVPSGTGLTISGGPHCDAGYWWQVTADNGVAGWVRESLGDERYLAP